MLGLLSRTNYRGKKATRNICITDWDKTDFGSLG